MTASTEAWVDPEDPEAERLVLKLEDPDLWPTPSLASLYLKNQRISKTDTTRESQCNLPVSPPSFSVSPSSMTRFLFKLFRSIPRMV